MGIRTHDLPEDVLRDILLRLPVKSLVRFRFVCKSWRSLLENTDFVTTHLNRSENHGSHLLVNSRVESTNISAPSLISNKTLDVEFTMDTSVKVEFGLMVGSCNGLVCVCNHSVILIWNPATREHKALPTPCVDPMFPNPLCMRVSVGFGFHLTDYKVVRVVNCRGLNGRPVPAKVEVYSTGTGCWRMINTTLPCDIEQRKCSVILKGVPYWLGFGPFWPDTIFKPGVARRNEFVVSFDMGEEAFRLMDVPDAGGSHYRYSKRLGVYNDSLAIIYFLCPEQVAANFIEFWVLKDQGVDECWSKVLRIGPFEYLGIPLGCWNNGVVIWQNHEDELLLHDPNTNEIKKLPIHGTPASTTTVSTYTESLVPVKEPRSQRSVGG